MGQPESQQHILDLQKQRSGLSKVEMSIPDTVYDMKYENDRQSLMNIMRESYKQADYNL